MKRKVNLGLVEAAKYVLSTYPLAISRIRPTDRGISNTSFFVSTSKGEYVLRIYAEGSELADINFEVKLLNTFAKAGVTVPEVMPNSKGLFVVTALVGKKQRHAILMRKLAGRIIEASDHGLIPAIARMHAKLHLIAKARIKPRRLAAKTLFYTQKWLAQELQGAQKEIAKTEIWEQFRKEVASAQTVLKEKALRMSKLPSAECHLDYDSDNILTDGKQVTAVIDLGDVTNSPLIVDIGNSLCWWLFCNPRKVGQKLLTQYLKAYEQVRPLSAQEKQLLLLCVKIRNLGLAMYFYSHGLRKGQSYARKAVDFSHFVDTLVV